MTQLPSLFDPPALARRSDPETSQAASRQIRGDLGRIQSTVLQLVKEHPGKTAPELARAAGIHDPRVVNRRLPELEKAGLVERCTPRKCSLSNRKAATWRASIPNPAASEPRYRVF